MDDPEALRKLLAKPRRRAYTVGPKIGALSGVDDPHWRAVMRPKPNDAAEEQKSTQILADVRKHGHLSGKRRGEPPTPGAIVVPDAPGQVPDELSDEQLIHYSGLKTSDAPYNRGTDIVGVNRDLAHTIDVAVKTGGAGGIEDGAHGILDEIDLGGLKAFSVEDAFARGAPGQNKHPVKGERAVRGCIPPTNVGHSVSVPLDDASPLETMLANLAKADDGTPDSPKTYKINTTRHPDTIDPKTGDPVEIDTFVPEDP